MTKKETPPTTEETTAAAKVVSATETPSAAPDPNAATGATASQTVGSIPDAPFCEAPEGWTESAVWTGSAFLDVLDPDPAAINLVEIARGLARQHRFGPALEHNYTVAEHSVGSYRIMRSIGLAEGWDVDKRRTLECAALLHDAPEYILGDMLSPIKRQCPDFSTLDDLLSRAIETRFDLPASILDCDEVRHVDRLACDTEARVFLPNMPPWPGMTGGHSDGMCRTTKPAAYFLRTAQSLGLV